MASSSSSSPELPLSRSTNTDQSLSIDRKLREVLMDLSSRFILNLPDGELDSLERVCFQVEQAHWYYEDFVREQDPSLPTMTLKRFSNSLFHVCPLLSHWGDEHEQTFQSFLAYKTRVPVCGAIMLNETWDKCLLVKGWKAASAWSFPRGKINQTEERHACAAREVLEETGYDLVGQIDPSNVVELSIREQSISLYIVPNVPEDFHFETRTRKEISKIAWFKLTDLPTWKRNKTVPGKFYLISPFIGPLKAFLRKHKPRVLQRAGDKPIHGDADVHTSGDEEGHLDAEIQDPGAIAHESSSQSSQENGDPHTPSPLYSEAIISHPDNGINSEMQKTLIMDNVDPHFARLLSSLSLSAKKSNATAPSVDSAPDPPLYSSPSNPPPSSQAQRPPLHARSLSSSGTSKPIRTPRTPSAAPHISPIHPTATIPRTSSRVGNNTQSRNPTLMPTQSMHMPAVVGGHAPTSPSPTTRRAGPPVDISPYLTRAATAAPSLPKQLKYISMLENVVKESERMTPKIERQIARNGPSFAMQSPLQPMPTSASLGNPQYGPGGEPSLIYSSRSGPHIAFPLHPHTSFPQLPSAASEDPFVVRPRTSNAIHPISYNSMSSRPSLTEDQLRLMTSLTGYHAPPPPAGPYPPPPFVGQPLNGPQLLGPPPTFTPNRLQPPLNLRVIAPQQLPIGPFAEPPPLSAPAVSPSFNLLSRANPNNNAHLLSILNNTSISRATPGGHQSLLSNVGPS